jgi:hypothetical protein
MPAKYIVYDGTESEANVARQPDDGMLSGIDGGCRWIAMSYVSAVRGGRLSGRSRTLVEGLI